VIVFNDWASQEISLYDEADTVEVEWTIGPIPVSDNIGKEIILRYDTDVLSQSKYYTDANGREVLERTRDYRPTWNYTVNEPVSGNYYPVNSRIWIKDQTRQFTVLTGKHIIFRLEEFRDMFHNFDIEMTSFVLIFHLYRPLTRWC